MNRKTRPLYVLIAVLLAIIIGIVAGILYKADQHSLPGAILAGGASFAGATTFILVLMREVGLFSPEPGNESGT